MTGGRDRGSILVLSLGFLVVALLLVLAVVDASDVFLAKRDAAGAADAAALAAADRVDVTRLYVQGLPTDSGQPLPLSNAGVREAVAEIAATYPGDWTFHADTPDGRHAVVTVTRVVQLPVFGSVTVSAESVAESPTFG